jgi:CRP-like cAMP-binding protein
MSSRAQPRVGNRILAALPRTEYERLCPHLEHVRFSAGATLYEVDDRIRYVYFPVSGMVSLLSPSSSGNIVEVGMIGNEGMTGLPVVLGVDRMPYRVTTQLTADALKLRTATLAVEFQRGAHMHNLLLQYLYTVLRQITQSALCHRFHTTEERLCRWLLTASDRAKSKTFHLTQESIAHMLGVPRTSVTMIANRLQQLNLVRLTRGRISIVDRQQLGHAACECYDIVASEVDHFLAS